MAEACRLDDGNPGLELGLSLGEGWQAGRDKICMPDAGGFGLWVEQLIAESTGKQGKGLDSRARRDRPTGPTARRSRCSWPIPTTLGQEFFRWEFATAVAGSILGINPFDQPDVQAAKDRTNEVLAAGDVEPEPESSLEELFAQAEPGDYVCVQAFVEPTPESERKLAALVERARRATGCVVTHGFGPRYLHSTGQLHKGGPNTGLFLQVVEDYGDELAIPGQAVRLRAADPRPGGRRLRVAAGARPARRADQARGARLMQLGMIGLGRMGGNMTDAGSAAGARREDLRPGRRVDRGDARGAARPAGGAAGVLDDGPGRRDHRVDRSRRCSRLAAPGDTIVDGGNSNFRDSQRRCAAAARAGDPTSSTPASRAASGGSRTATA